MKKTKDDRVYKNCNLEDCKEPRYHKMPSGTMVCDECYKDYMYN